MERVRRSRKRVRFMFATATVLFLLGLFTLWFGAFLEKRGYVTNFLSLILIGVFLLFFIGSFVLFIRSAEDFSFYDIEDKKKKYLAVDLKKLTGIMEETINEKYKLNKFKENAGGYLRRKKYIIIKHYICYYIRTANVVDIEKTINKELNRFDNLIPRSKNDCLVLFLCKSGLQSEDFKLIREANINSIISETLNKEPYGFSCIIILVDEWTKEGYFLDVNNKLDISIYGNGCRYLKKIFKVV